LFTDIKVLTRSASRVMTNVTEFRIALSEVDLLRGQGMDPDRARPPLISAARSVLGEVDELLAPAACYRILSIEAFEVQKVHLAGGAILEGPLVARALTGARQVALALCTLGPALERRVSDSFTADPVRAMALDGAGIAALAQVSRAIQKEIGAKASSRGWRIGMSISPGQEGWPLLQQRTLFQLLAATSIDVQLTESCLMVPRKSVSFAIGMGENLCTDKTSCDCCSKEERCGWRAREEGYDTP
jgi:hypothetical protein